MDYDFGYEDHLFFSDILSKYNNFLQVCFFFLLFKIIGKF